MNRLNQLVDSLFTAIFALGSLAGIAMCLHQSASWPKLHVLISAALYSGVCVLAAGFLLYDFWGQTNPYLLTGVCMLAGIGGADVLMIIVQMIFKGRFDIKVLTDEAKHDDKK